MARSSPASPKVSLKMSIRRQLLSQSAGIFAARIAGAGAIFAIQALMARLWGAEALGQYLLAIAAANLLAVCLPLGFQTIGTFFVADYAARGAGRSLRRYMLHAYGHILMPGLAILVALGLLLPSLGGSAARLATVWVPISLLAVGTAVVFLNGAVLVGLKRPFAGFAVDMLVRPLIVGAAFAALVAAGPGANGLDTLIWILGISYAAAAAAHFGFTLHCARRVPEGPHETAGSARTWWYFALPWAIVALSADFFFDLDLMMLSALMRPDEIAVFGVCARIFVLASFGVNAVYAVAVPGVMEDEARKDPAALQHRIGEANLAATGLALVLMAGMAVFGPFVLGLFGPEFATGAVPLVVLCAALAVRAAFGPASLILSARNRPYASLPAVGAGVLVLVGANLLMVPAWGVNGAAIAAFLALSTGATGLWLTALNQTGVDVSIRAFITRGPAGKRTAD